MDWSEEIEFIKNMSEEDFETYRKIRFGSLSDSFVKAMILVGIFLFIGYCCSKAQSFASPEYERIARQAVLDALQEYDYLEGVERVGVVIMAECGNVVCNVALKSQEGEMLDIADGNYNYDIPTPLARSVMFLAIVPQIPSSQVIDAGNGYYVDKEGAVILDENWTRGGYHCLDILHAQDRSSVAMIKAAEQCFNRNMSLLCQAINRTGIMFGARAYADEDSYWNGQEIMGSKTHMTLLEIVAYVHAIAKPDGKIVLRLNEHDTCEPIDSISNKTGLEELRKAMRLAVTEGLCLNLKSNYTNVAGLTHRTITPDAGMNYNLFAAAYWPFENPRFTIAVNVTKKGHPTGGRAFPSRIAQLIIDRITHQEILSMEEKGKEYIHPAER